MNKRKRTMLIVAIILIIAVSFLGGQTFAKYVSQVRGEGVAEIATWNFKVNGQKEQVQQINLASTYNNETLVDNKLAPGTTGNFKIVVDGTGSDVGIDYNITFANESTKPENIKFIYNDVQYNSISELGNAMSGTINANDENKERTLEVEWIWNYETGNDEIQIASNDSIDTQNAEEIAQYTFDVIVSGTQVLPQN